MVVDTFISNSTYLSGGRSTTHESVERNIHTDEAANAPHMLMLTGPNHSGKSVYLKQVALITYLAHIGSFVPASSATIGLTDKILTRISTPETVSYTSSAFMIDLQQITLALNLATPRSLLLIDEFGKGTNANDGAALAYGVFQHLIDRSYSNGQAGANKACKTLVATHYHELFEQGLLTPQPGVMFAHMDVQVDEAARDAHDQVTYLYRLCAGRSLASYGSVCASLNGVPEAVVKRAEQLVKLAAQGTDLVVECGKMTENFANELAAAVSELK